MPNWCENDLYIRGTKKQLLEFISKYTVQAEENGFCYSYFDFNKVIPQPEVCDVLDWRWENWGTKWNARDTYFDADFLNDCKGNKRQELHISFNTAWNEPDPVIAELTRQNPKLDIMCNYFEPGAFFGGTFINGKNLRFHDETLIVFGLKEGYITKEDLEESD